MTRKITPRQVLELFDLDKLEEYCTAPSEWFFDRGSVKVISAGADYESKRFLIHKDNGASILAAAHLDTVAMYFDDLDFNLFEVKHDSDFGVIVRSPNMDDRMGAYIILELLPKLGINADILLCDTEELGLSTASYFKTTKDYNWIFEFDRAGTDVVMYQYEDKETRQLLESHGFETSVGAFSDISELESLGVKAFNFGTGYYNAHTNDCFTSLDRCAHMVAKFANFHHKLKDTRLPHINTEDSLNHWMKF